MPYTKTTWTNGTTPADAPNMNNIENGIANALANDGSNGVSVTLAGANQTVATWTATDGKTYKLIMRHTDNALVLFNSTDAVNICEFGPTAGAITANGATVWTSANDGSGSGLDADKLDGISSSGFTQSGHVSVIDNGSTVTQQLFTGTTDPATIGGVTVNNGDIWLKG